ncbi:MAG: hypothetical protein HQL87_10495 [Magnetococcales bacterium]|nr:hypothetical protein [Magnetococcales bacterium]
MKAITTRPAHRYLLAVTGIVAILTLSRFNLEGFLPLIFGVSCCGVIAGLLLRASATPYALKR